jgi:hypothetical protein
MTLEVTATSRKYGPQPGSDARIGHVLDDIAGHDRIGLDADADAGPVVRIGAGRTPADEIADQVALHDREPAALVEIRHRHAERGAVDDVVGDDRALKTELGIEGDFAEAAAGVADDLQVGSGIAAHRGKSGIANAIAAHDHIVGAKDVDGVAPLAGSAGFVHHAFDAVVDDQCTVVAWRAAPDQNAAVAGSANGVAGNLQAARIDRKDGGVAACYRVGGDFALDGLKRNAVATGIDDFAIGNADRAAVRHVQ